MKKISERAIEIMVDNDKSDGFQYSYRIHNYPGYPSVGYVTVVDLALALDEYQEENNKAFRALGGEMRTATDPRLYGGQGGRE